MNFKSLGKRCLGFICALVIAIVIIPVLPCESGTVFAATHANQSSQTVGPGGGYSVTYYGEAGLTFEVSKNKEMFGSTVDVKSSKTDGIYAYRIYVRCNASKNERNGLLLVKKKGSIVYRINVKQQGIYLKVEPEFKRNIINGYGQVIYYNVTTNANVKVYYTGETDTGAKGLISSFGFTSSLADKITTHRVKVTYPANNSNRWRPMAVGVVFVAGPEVKSFIYDQASTHNSKQGYSSKNPLGTIRHNGYDYKITISDLENNSNYDEIDTISEKSIDFNASFAGFLIPSGGFGLGVNAVSVFTAFIDAVGKAQRNDVTFKYYQNRYNKDDRQVKILVNDFQLSRVVDNPPSRPIRKPAKGAKGGMVEIYYDECRLSEPDLQLTLDKNGNWVESFRSFSKDYIKDSLSPIRFNIPHYNFDNPSTLDGTQLGNDYSSPFPSPEVSSVVCQLADKALAR